MEEFCQELVKIANTTNIKLLAITDFTRISILKLISMHCHFTFLELYIPCILVQYAIYPPKH
jgi:hypothetical protein